MRVVYRDRIVEAERVARIDAKRDELEKQRQQLAVVEHERRQALQNERETFLQERDAWVEAASAAKLLAWKQAQEDAVAPERVLDIAMLVAEKIVSEEIRVRPEAIRTFVDEALAKYRADEALVVRVHPLDMELLTKARPDIELQADPTLERGDVLIDAASGNIDARIRTRLERIRHALMQSD